MESPSIRSLTNIAVFGGTTVGATVSHLIAAIQLGRVLAHRKIGLVYGGRNTGLIGEVARAHQSYQTLVQIETNQPNKVLAIGVIPTHLKQIYGKTIGHEVQTKSFYELKNLRGGVN